MATINLRLSDELRNEFKALCAKRGISVTGQLTLMMTRELEAETRTLQRKLEGASKKR